MSDTHSNQTQTGPDTRYLRNRTSIAGMMLTTITAILFLGFLLLEAFGVTSHANPYLGIVFFIVLPALFALGLLLIPLGIWRERRRRLHGLPASLSAWPRIDLNDSRVRAAIFAIIVLTPVNLVILSAGAVKGVEAMDSVSFCGQVCHSVMAPQAIGHQFGPHARVKCVACHIGSGPSAFVKAKLNGAHQVVALMTDSYARPVPAPVEDLRTARDTCESCHSPTQFHGARIVNKTEFASDETNTESTSTLRLHVGGTGPAGRSRGIHWHASPQNVVEYVAVDPQRQQIGYVKVTSGGETREYFAEGVTESQIANAERRQMECVDCHNRAGHPFARSADRAVNEVIAAGGIPKDLPFVKREAVAALDGKYSDEQTAAAQIADRIAGFYRNGYPALWTSRQADITRAAKNVGLLYTMNVFPSMNIGWGTYPDNQGHMEFQGCFRCHDDAHKTKDGRAISQSCELCHEMQ